MGRKAVLQSLKTEQSNLGPIKATATQLSAHGWVSWLVEEDVGVFDSSEECDVEGLVALDEQQERRNDADQQAVVDVQHDDADERHDPHQSVRPRLRPHPRNVRELRKHPAQRHCDYCRQNTLHTSFRSHQQSWRVREMLASSRQRFITVVFLFKVLSSSRVLRKQPTLQFALAPKEIRIFYSSWTE